MIDVRIDALAYGGAGVARHEGKAVFVPLTAPGELVRCRVTRDHRRFSEAEAVEVLAASPRRRPPPCPHFGACGGCQWQHLPYGEQCAWKERIFADILQRQARVSKDVIQPLAPSPSEWNYRSRVQFKCRQAGQGFVMGFYRRGSHFVIDVADCPITAPRLNETLRLFRRWLPASPCPKLIPQVDLEADDEGRIRATVHCLDRDPAPLADFLGPLAESEGLSLFLQTGRKETLERVCGVEELHIRPLAHSLLRLAYGAGGFAQVNLEQNRRLVSAVLEAASLSGTERVLDLFCGMGNFSLPLARGAGTVVGVEDYAPAIARAERNARSNGIANARFLARPAEGAPTALAGAGGFDLVLLDPPRTGACAVARELATLRPPCIIYVSCDPPTLARDLVPLLHQGYAVVSSQPFDLFPQTHHTESLTVLRRVD
jgi:23S rRNA (uracil1939-C5)-methyltransferase